MITASSSVMNVTMQPHHSLSSSSNPLQPNMYTAFPRRPNARTDSREHSQCSAARFAMSLIQKRKQSNREFSALLGRVLPEFDYPPTNQGRPLIKFSISCVRTQRETKQLSTMPSRPRQTVDIRLCYPKGKNMPKSYVGCFKAADTNLYS